MLVFYIKIQKRFEIGSTRNSRTIKLHVNIFSVDLQARLLTKLDSIFAFKKVKYNPHLSSAVFTTQVPVGSSKQLKQIIQT